MEHDFEEGEWDTYGGTHKYSKTILHFDFHKKVGMIPRLLKTFPYAHSKIPDKYVFYNRDDTFMSFSEN